MSERSSAEHFGTEIAFGECVRPKRNQQKRELRKDGVRNRRMRNRQIMAICTHLRPLTPPSSSNTRSFPDRNRLKKQKTTCQHTHCQAHSTPRAREGKVRAVAVAPAGIPATRAASILANRLRPPASCHVEPRGSEAASWRARGHGRDCTQGYRG